MHQIPLTQWDRNIDISILHSGSYLWIDACFIIALNNETLWIGTKGLNLFAWVPPASTDLPSELLTGWFWKGRASSGSMLPTKVMYSRQRVRQSLHCNMIFHLLLSHHHKELMQGSELLFRPAELSWTSLSVHANILKNFPGDFLGRLMLQRSVMKTFTWCRDHCWNNCPPAMTLLTQAVSQGCAALSPFELWGYPKTIITLEGQWGSLDSLLTWDRIWEDSAMVMGTDLQLLSVDGAGEKQWSPGVGRIHLFS